MKIMKLALSMEIILKICLAIFSFWYLAIMFNALFLSIKDVIDTINE